MTPRISLYGAGLGLIIEHPSGVLYTNQTCGHCCCRPEAEGVFVPFDAETSWERLCNYFEGPKYNGSGAMRGIDEEDALFIESVLRDARLGVPIAVDRERLEKSHEAWVFVFIQGETDYGPLGPGFGPYPKRAILTWPNSD